MICVTFPLGQLQRRSGLLKHAMSSGSVLKLQSMDEPKKLRNIDGTCVPVGSSPPASINSTLKWGTCQSCIKIVSSFTIKSCLDM